MHVNVVLHYSGGPVQFAVGRSVRAPACEPDVVKHLRYMVGDADRSGQQGFVVGRIRKVPVVAMVHVLVHVGQIENWQAVYVSHNSRQLPRAFVELARELLVFRTTKSEDCDSAEHL